MVPELEHFFLYAYCDNSEVGRLCRIREGKERDDGAIR